jgi:cytochrome c oxidase subunit 2
MRPSLRSLVTTASLVVLLAAAIVWAAYPQTDAMDGAGDVGADGVREITVRVYGWGMSPGVIRVAPGQRVRFVVATDDVMHGFAINELGVNLALSPGRASRSGEVHVDLPEGTYAIHCSVFCGLGHGSMKSRLVVGSPPPDPKRTAPWIASGLTVLLVAALVGAATRRGRQR